MHVSGYNCNMVRLWKWISWLDMCQRQYTKLAYECIADTVLCLRNWNFAGEEFKIEELLVSYLFQKCLRQPLLEILGDVYVDGLDEAEQQSM